MHSVFFELVDIRDFVGSPTKSMSKTCAFCNLSYAKWRKKAGVLRRVSAGLGLVVQN